jgi:hypothetical protein
MMRVLGPLVCRHVRSRVILALLIAIVPAAAAAQTPPSPKPQPAAKPQTATAKDGSHWGVIFSATPSWTITDQVKKVIFDDGSTGSISGNEFTIGFVRGSTRGGDFGVSYVRKPWDDGSGEIKAPNQQCVTPSNCATSTESTLSQGVYLSGFEVHWTPSFVTIKNHFQIGLNVAGGLSWMHGEVVKTTTGTQFTFNTGKPVLAPANTTETVPAQDEFLKYFPLFKLEVAGSVIITRALKFRVTGGLNFPAYTAGVGFVYLIGA